MRNFMNIFKGELLKSFKGKTILIMVAIVMGATLFFSLIYGLTVDAYKEMLPAEEDMSDYTPSDVIEGIDIELADLDIKLANNEITKYKHQYQRYTHLAHRAVMVYMQENDLKFNEFNMYNGDDMLRTATRQNLLIFILMSSSFIIGVIATVLAAGAVNDELNNGTLRLLLICPVNRVKLLLAKQLAIMTQIALAIAAIIFTAVIMGFLLHPGVGIKVMVVINASRAFLVPFVISVALQAAMLMIYALIISVIVMSFVFVFRSKVFGIIVGVIISLNVINAALLIRPKLIDIFSYTILTNMNFNGFLSLAGNNYGQLTLPSAILVYIINILLLFGVSSLLFKLRDIN